MNEETVDFSIKITEFPKAILDMTFTLYQVKMKSEGREVDLKHRFEIPYDQAVRISGEHGVSILISLILAYQATKTERNIN